MTTTGATTVLLYYLERIFDRVWWSLGKEVYSSNEGDAWQLQLVEPFVGKERKEKSGMIMLMVFLVMVSEPVEGRLDDGLR